MEKYQLEPIKAFKYVTEPNSYIYRPIVRFLYNKRMGFELYNTTIGDIYRLLAENNIIDENYSEFNLQESLGRLEEWEVIKSRQEEQSGMTIEEFKKKRYTYQITDLGVEIESLLIRIDELDEQLVGNLDSRQFSLLLKHLERFRDIEPTPFLSPERISEYWTSVFDTHKTLRKNASDYLYHIQEAEKANLFNSELFLEFKDKFMQYLGTYISELERVKFKIYKVINEIKESHVNKYIDALIEGNKPNSFLQENYSEEKLRVSLKNRWMELKVWFLGTGGSRSDIEVLSDSTKEAIRIIVTYANRLSDASMNTKNRISEYQSLARKFKNCSSLKGAHELYATAFGVSHSRSLYAPEEITIVENGKYTNEDEIWNTNIKPIKIPNMGNRGPRGSSKASAIKNNKHKQQQKIIESIEKKREEERKIMELIKDGRIILADIKEPLEPFQRKTILKWLTRTAKLRLKKTIKSSIRTETGMTIRVRYRSKNMIVIPSKDGVLRGPDIEFIVEDGEE